MTSRFMATVWCLVLAGPAFADDAETVVKAWAARRAEVKNVWAEMDVELVRKKDTDPKSRNLLGKQDYTSKTQLTLILDFEKGRSRKQVTGELFSIDTMANRPIDACQAYDGTTLRTVATPPPGQKSIVGQQRGYVADYGEYTGDLSGSTYDMNVMPVFYSCGLVPMKVHDRFWPGQFHKYDMSEWTDALGTSPRATTTAGARWYALPVANYSLDYLVEVTPGRRVSEMVYGRKGGAQTRQLKIKYGKVGPVDGPVSWEYKEVLDYGGEGVVKCVVRKLAYNVPLDDSLFTCSPSEGMTAIKLKFPEPDADPHGPAVESQKYFKVEDGQRLVEIDSPAPGSTPNPNRNGGTFWWWVGGSLGVATALAGLLLVWRKRSRPTTPPMAG